jgi:CPA2 family monovalent cation:H+ antiporter-2
MNIHTLQIILLLLGVAVLTVTLFRRLHLPPILGYLIVGILVGPFGSGLVASSEETRFLAEFGVVFLLFSIGLEFSLPQMIAMKGSVFGLGGSQVLLTGATIALLAWLLGLPVQAAASPARSWPSPPPPSLLNSSRNRLSSTRNTVAWG